MMVYRRVRPGAMADAPLRPLMQGCDESIDRNVKASE
jgi:hypothetical protein